MKAVVVEKFDPEYQLAVREVDPPSEPVGSEVVVRVRAAGLNRADLLQARGLYPPPKGYSADRPGLEFAGEVEVAGDSVARWKIGDRVFGITAGEAQAELVRTDERLLAAIPDNLNFASAAAVPEAFITASDAIFSQASLRTDEVLLIHAVGSGVGLAALQVAKANGNFVIGTSRTAAKLERCRNFGLDIAVETNGGDFAETVMKKTNGRGADVILDLVGGGYFEQNLASLAPKGRLVVVGLTSGRVAKCDLGLVLQKRAKIIGTVLRVRSTDEKADATRRFETDVLPLLASGKIRPNVDRVFPAAEAAEAYRHLSSDATFGKVVLVF